MLKKQAMAIKVSKITVGEAIKDTKDNNLKESVTKTLEKAYIAGYDLAVQELKNDNSGIGFEMAEYLEELQEDQP